MEAFEQIQLWYFILIGDMERIALLQPVFSESPLLISGEQPYILKEFETTCVCMKAFSSSNRTFTRTLQVTLSLSIGHFKFLCYNYKKNLLISRKKHVQMFSVNKRKRSFCSEFARRCKQNKGILCQ